MSAQIRIWPEEVQQLQDQLHNPQHCWIEYVPGQVVRHKKASRDFDQACPQLEHLLGTPVRFTRMAAERLIEQLGWKNATLIRIPR